MAKKVWQLIVFQPLQRQVTLTCLQLIKSECQNKEINTQLISAVLQSFDLALLFKSVVRVTNATVKLENIVEDHFCLMNIENSKLYVKRILDNHTEFFKLVRCFLNNDQHFIAALSKACGNFINNNTITKATRNTKKSAELLTLYCDALLRQGYCSQFDALDSLLTAREHSYLYIIEYSLQRFDLIVCADRLVKQYPSDNEHKLSTAILLIGNPSIVFMDICGWKFEKNFTAVKQGECFDLLRINSSRKSTIFTMLTGEISMTDDNAFVNNCSVIKQLDAIHQNLGHDTKSKKE
ncbi:unnamed protein product [Rotaria sordida]|uniref:Cullin N-terminal domain-containing protein n=1 Tax=Rotaria sordida TaxID=392033 RepID=A0A815KM22_9BILA|nr:unnamed protein product [Rotaria sordida]